MVWATTCWEILVPALNVFGGNHLFGKKFDYLTIFGNLEQNVSFEDGQGFTKPDFMSVLTLKYVSLRVLNNSVERQTRDPRGS